MTVQGMKQIIVIRTDLKMGRGKIAAQAGHAAVLGADKVRKIRPQWFREWIASGQAKIAVRAGSLEELLEIKVAAETIGLPVVEVEDRGLTQLPPGTMTCMAIGPAPAGGIDQVTGSLRLL